MTSEGDTIKVSWKKMEDVEEGSSSRKKRKRKEEDEIEAEFSLVVGGGIVEEGGKEVGGVRAVVDRAYRQ